MTEESKSPICGIDVWQAIYKAYPDKIITDDILLDEDSWYTPAMHGKLFTALASSGGVDMLYDRPPQPEPDDDDGNDDEDDDDIEIDVEADEDDWDMDIDPDDLPWDEETHSYGLFFLGLEDEEFQEETTLNQVEELESGETLVTTGPARRHIGFAVGVSTIAPFAIVRVSEMLLTDTGEHTEPDLGGLAMDEDEELVDNEALLRQQLDEKAIAKLDAVRERIAAALASKQVRVLREEELAAELPGFVVQFVGLPPEEDEDVTVESALFFTGM